MAFRFASPARLRDAGASAARSSSPRFSSPSPSRTRATCLCSPTNHPGSFRCSMHRSQALRSGSGRSSPSSPSSSNRLDARAKAKAKDLRTLLLAMIRPSRHDLYRRRTFQPQPSRFCVMNSGAEHQMPGILAA